MHCDENSMLLEDYATVTLQCEGLELEIDSLRKALIVQAQKQHHVAQHQETHNELTLMNISTRQY